MKHIDTVCKDEKKARNDYAKAETDTNTVADEALEATVRKLLALRHKMDEDELEASKMKAVIMKAMKKSDTLKSKDGTLLVTWRQGSSKKTVDYKSIFKKYKVTKEDIEANTTTKIGSRAFVLELD